MSFAVDLVVTDHTKLGIGFVKNVGPPYILEKVEPGSWGDRNHLRPGDTLLAVNGTLCIEMTWDEFITNMTKVRPLTLTFVMPYDSFGVPEAPSHDELEAFHTRFEELQEDWDLERETARDSKISTVQKEPMAVSQKLLKPGGAVPTALDTVLEELWGDVAGGVMAREDVLRELLYPPTKKQQEELERPPPGPVLDEATQRMRDRLELLDKVRSNLNEEGYTKDNIEEVFDKVDEDGSGEIEVLEFQKLMDLMQPGMTTTQVRLLYGHFDNDMQMPITYDMFSEGLYPMNKIALLEEIKVRIRSQGYTKATLQDLFGEVDTDGSGEIEFKEFRKLTATVHPGLITAQIRILYNHLDRDGEGSISYWEFENALFAPLPDPDSEAAKAELKEEAEMILQKVRNAIKKKGCSMQKIKESFDKVDEDGSGEIEFLEFKQLMDDMHGNLTVDKIRKLFTVFDKDGSGALTCEEFQRILFPESNIGGPSPEEEAAMLLEKIRLGIQKKGTSSEKLRMIFNQLDRDGSGELEFEEFGKLIEMVHSAIPEEKLQHLFGMFDKDHQGSIDFDEFKKTLQTSGLQQEIDRLKERLTERGYTRENIRGCFDKFDSERNGGLDFGDFKRLLEAMDSYLGGMDRDRQKALFDLLKGDGYDTISLQALTDNLYQLTAKDRQREEANGLLDTVRKGIQKKGHTVEKLRQLFNQLDTDGSGEMDFSEFKKLIDTLFGYLGEEKVRKIFVLFDEDGEGSISFDEFQRTLFPPLHPLGSSGGPAGSMPEPTVQALLLELRAVNEKVTQLEARIRNQPSSPGPPQGFLNTSPSPAQPEFWPEWDGWLRVQIMELEQLEFDARQAGLAKTEHLVRQHLQKLYEQRHAVRGGNSTNEEKWQLPDGLELQGHSAQLTGLRKQVGQFAAARYSVGPGQRISGT
eukprot:gnl/MRDRNA2_/MRDRNA2_110783_c0_seq1.p1 gnl/MRDRNA2_/MRDRNA2_110783_c0~~gnl/MRDRNA2_/MRDRNA2_110783_c0_seq1.p1  ORF type:complete len:920 (+),score=242.14 gnl/MRDRNA2_/MRDRNA2_110783_c0_seq1:99-2858(+)